MEEMRAAVQLRELQNKLERKKARLQQKYQKRVLQAEMATQKAMARVEKKARKTARNRELIQAARERMSAVASAEVALST